MRAHRPRGYNILPPVVKNLLIINGLFFLATITFYTTFNTDLIRILGLHFVVAQNFEPYQFITYMFMHGGFPHLLFNMFALWMFGNLLENVWGGKRFIIYYFVTGIGAAIIHYVVLYFQLIPTLQAINEFLADPSNNELLAFLNSEHFKVLGEDWHRNTYIPFVNEYNSLVNIDPEKALVAGVNFMKEYRVDLLNAPVVVGASGAVFGILLAFGMMFPNHNIYLFFAIPIKAKYFVIMYGALELYFGITGGRGNIAHFAHLGGMLFGYLMIIYWKRKGTLY